MKKVHLRSIVGLLALLACSTVAMADEGMWLLTLLKQQNHAKMQEMGLKLSAEEIYNTTGDPMLMDAVVHFGGGCTGEVVSADGLIFTNHHCGYDEIQYHSSVEHNYLKYGFYASTLKDELPSSASNVTFIDEILEVTSYVEGYLARHHLTNPMEYLRPQVLNQIANEWYATNRGEKKEWVELELSPMYEGNRFYLFVKKVYADVRLVAAPPSCVGSYGSDSDNWTWPRHSADFSVFRVYTAPNGDPAKYSAENIPLKPKRYLKINARGVQLEDFVMIIGFPGRTYHFFTPWEVEEFRNVENQIRVDMRKVRQDAMLEEMKKDEAVNIQYAAKYQGSTNAYKRAIGSSWAIDNQKIELVKRKQADKLRTYAEKHHKQEYISAIERLETIVADRRKLAACQMYLVEGITRSVELVGAPMLSEKEYNAMKQKPALLDQWLEEKYAAYFNKDYNADVDKVVSKAVIRAYKEADDYNGIFADVKDVSTYVESLFEQTIYRDRRVLKDFILTNSYAEYMKDPVVHLNHAVERTADDLAKKLSLYNEEYRRARQTYLKGILEMEGEKHLWPDANSTMRYTFGRVRGYSPRDQVEYGHQTTMKGVMEKYKPGDYEYDLLPEIISIYENKDFGGLNTLSNGEMPVDFCATTHTTGGNSGSPVMNADGYLVGLNFDRNWEGVGGDINYLPDYQRSIICDVRYVLLILDKYLKADRIINELDIVQ